MADEMKTVALVLPYIRIDGIKYSDEEKQTQKHILKANLVILLHV